MLYRSCKKHFSYLFTMDSVFFLGEEDLSTFFQNMMQQFGCTYLCLWFYSPQAHQSSNYLCYKDGFYIERNTQQTASSSAGTMAQTLFNEYRQSIFVLDISRHIPGIAFQNNLPYMEFNFIDLLTFATTDIQRQFYQEAGIKTAVFLGCNVGEIEMGFSSDTNQVNLKMLISNWFPEDFSRTPLLPTDLPQPTDPPQNPAGAASSSSSLRSYSYDSTADYSPLLFDIPTSSNYTSPEAVAADLEQAALRPAPSSFTVPTANPHHQAMIRTILSHSGQGQDNRIPYVDTVLAVISSSPSSNFQPRQNVPTNKQGSAFKRYRQTLAPRISNESRIRVSGQQRRQNMLKRCISFIRRLNTMRAQEEQIQANRPSSAQLHHMISERRRREKINDSFQALRSLLPPGTKKDKASVLARTTEYLSTLKAQVAELSKRNQILETTSRLLPRKTEAIAITTPEASTTSISSNRNTLDVRITNVNDSSSTSEVGRTVDLHVTRRGGENGIVDNVVRLLEFLRRDENVRVMSIEANSTALVDSILLNKTILRLKIQEGSEWDQSAFQEAVERLFN